MMVTVPQILSGATHRQGAFISSAYCDNDQLYLVLRAELDSDLAPLADDFCLSARGQHCGGEGAQEQRIVVNSIELQSGDQGSVMVCLLERALPPEASLILHYRPSDWLMCWLASGKSIEAFDEAVDLKPLTQLDPALYLKAKNAVVSEACELDGVDESADSCNDNTVVHITPKINQKLANDDQTLAYHPRRKRGVTKIAHVMSVLAVLGAGSLLIVANFLLKPPPVSTLPESAIPTKVETVVAVPATRRLEISSQGSVTPAHEVKLIAEVGGRLVNAADQYADGGFFTQGEMLVTIDPRDYQFALRQAEADLAKARELHAIEKARARQAKREWRDIGDREANRLFLREPQLTAAEAAVDAALAMRDQAKLNLSRTVISAPFSGRIQHKHVDVGQYVSPGTIISEVYSSDTMQVRLPLTDRQLALIDLPLNANTPETLPTVRLSTKFGGQTYSWPANIVRTEAALDAKSRVVYAVAEVHNHSSASTTQLPLAAGMYVTAKIRGKALPGVVKLPRKVLQKKDQIMVVDHLNALQFKTVNLVQSDGEHILVTGLTKGERVLLTRVPNAIAGLQVEPTATAVAADSGPASPSPKQAEAQEG